MSEKAKSLICTKCQVPLVSAKVTFQYLNRSLEHAVLRCPDCGQVYLSEELVKDKMVKVETSLEEK